MITGIRALLSRAMASAAPGRSVTSFGVAM